jgi:hypothetical protein
MVRTGSLIIVADLGELKAYRMDKLEAVNRQDEAKVSHIVQRGDFKEARVLIPLKDINYIKAHGKLEDVVSDEAGRFKGGASTAGEATRGSYGERHNIDLENRKRLLKAIAEDIGELVKKEASHAWYLAFPHETTNQLLEHLDPEVKKTLANNITVDLTKTRQNEILSHF